MPRRTHIRTKLAAALAIPLLALVAVAGFEAFTAIEAADDARAESELATAAVGPGSFLTNLQNERNRASIDLIGLGGATTLPVDNNTEARALTDASLVELRAALEGSGSSEVADAFAPALAGLEDLAEVRADTDAYDGPMDPTNREFANQIFTRYTAMTLAFFDSVSAVSRAIDNADLRGGAAIVDAATRQSEMRARIVRDVVFATIGGAVDSMPVRQDMAALWSQSLGFDDNIHANATGPYEGVADATYTDPGVVAFSEQMKTYLTGGAIEITPLLDSVRTAPDSGYTGLRTRAAEVLGDEADAVVDDAAMRQQLFLAIAAGVVLVALILTWLMSRSITRPLRSLRAQAEEMAEERLPAAVQAILDTPMGEDVLIPPMVPITVKTRDEVRDVATALNTVQQRALDLAVEQAVLRRNISDSFVNLGRRNQNLLNRQLELITDLESAETDPDELASLFRLDHLATRMRRNAESLLVLAGVEPPRQWSAPVDIADVVRSALGEVEDYQRVSVRHLEPATLVGSAATDISHVLAELIENGLTFSPPEHDVEVKGRLTPSAYTIAITDNGVGLGADELERANKRLAGQEEFTVAPSRYLGHYVAGHLAQRHGIEVDIQDDPAGGTLARVLVPLSLINDSTLGAGSMGPAAPRLEPPRPAVEARDDADDTVTAPAELVPAAREDEWRPSEDDWPEPAVPETSGVPVAPPTASEAHVARHLRTDQDRGFGGLAPLWGSGDDGNGTGDRNGNGHGSSDSSEDLAPTTASGLARRVPGMQRPDVVARVLDAPTETASDHADDDATSTPEDVYAFLSKFASGVERGRADAHGTEGSES